MDTKAINFCENDYMTQCFEFCVHEIINKFNLNIVVLKNVAKFFSYILLVPI